MALCRNRMKVVQQAADAQQAAIAQAAIIAQGAAGGQ